MEDLPQFVGDSQCIAMLYVCDQMVILQTGLGGKLHGTNARDIFMRRPWAAGHLTASLKKDLAVSSKNRESVNKPQEGVSFKRRPAWGADGASK